MRLKNSYINYPRYGYAREKRELENGGGGELYTWMNKRIYIGRRILVRRFERKGKENDYNRR